MEKLTSWKAFEIVLSVLMTICLALAAWSLKQLHETSIQIASITESQNSASKNLTKVVEMVEKHESTLAIMSGNRFTSSDGLTIWKEIAAIRENLAKLPTEGFAALPIRISSLEQSKGLMEQQIIKLMDELQSGRKERLTFQGETKAELAKLNGKMDGLRDLLESKLTSNK